MKYNKLSTHFILLLILSLSIKVQAQNLEVEYDSNTSNPIINLKETGNNDFTRLYFTNANTTDRWILAPLMGTTVGDSVFGLYYNGTARWVYSETNRTFDLMSNEIDLQGEDGLDTRIRIRGGGANHFIFNDDSNNDAFKLESGDDFVINTGGVNERVRIDGSTGDITLSEDVTVSNELTVLQDLVLDGQSNPRIDFQNQSPPGTGAEIIFDYDGTGIPNNAGNAGDLVIRNTRTTGDIEFYTENLNKIFRMTGNDLVESLGERFDVKHNAGTLVRGLRIENTTNSNWFQFYASSSTGNMSLVNSSNGLVGTFSSTGVYTASDRKLKENINDITYNISDLMQLSAKEYNYKKGDRTKTIGFIAQEVKEVLPELVNHDKETDTHLINYAGMSVIAIKAIQDQQEMIEKLQSENTILKTQLEEIKLLQQEILSKIDR